MNKAKNHILKQPLIFSLFILALSVAITFIPLSPLFCGIFEEQAAGYIAGIIEQTMVTFMLIHLLKKLGLIEKAGFKRKSKELWILWPIIPFVLLNASDFLTGSLAIDKSKPLLVILFVLVYLSTGLFEETLCRGVIFNLMLNKWEKSKGGYYLAVMLSSVLFGLVHFIHYFLGDASLIATITQVIYASFIGVFFCACVVRNQSIYPAMILHGIVNIAGSLDEIAVNGGINKAFRTISVEGAIICVIIVLPLFVYGLFVVRKEFGKSAVCQEIE